MPRRMVDLPDPSTASGGETAGAGTALAASGVTCSCLGACDVPCPDASPSSMATSLAPEASSSDLTGFLLFVSQRLLRAEDLRVL